MSAAETAAIERVVAHIDDHADEIVEFAAELIRRPSVNPDLDPNPLAERPAQEWLHSQLGMLGTFDALDMWEVAENRPNVVAKRTGRGGGRSLTWSSHVDVVPVTPEQAEQWDGDPFSGEVRDGNLHGRGTSDMKSAAAASILAAHYLRACDIDLNGDLTIALASGEESGRRDIGCNTILERGYRADLAIFPEVSNFRVHPVAKGELYFKLTVPGKSTHICNRNLVAQALPYGVERPGVSAIDNMLKYQLAILELERQWLLWQSSPVVAPGGMYINVNTMQAGSSLTSIPDSAEATGSCLFYPHLTADEVMADIRATVDRVTAGDAWLREHPPVLDLPLDSTSDAPWVKEPVNTPFDHPGVLAIVDAMERLTGETPVREVSPFVCDANFWSPLGQQSVIWGIGDVTYGVHGANEFIPVADIILGTKAFAATSILWCGVAD